MSARALRRVSIPLALAAAACGHDFEPPDRGARVREAEEAYAPALFDTLAWASDADRLTLGNEIYAEKCRLCHGPLGRGDTDYARERGLEIPSLVEPDWPLASADSLHRRIYVGHEGGMPVYGDQGMSPRDIDAVARYILSVLRPDVLELGQG